MEVSIERARKKHETNTLAQKKYRKPRSAGKNNKLRPNFHGAFVSPQFTACTFWFVFSSAGLPCSHSTFVLAALNFRRPEHAVSVTFLSCWIFFVNQYYTLALYTSHRYHLSAHRRYLFLSSIFVPHIRTHPALSRLRALGSCFVFCGSEPRYKTDH